jgi:hypothetical protein
MGRAPAVKRSGQGWTPEQEAQRTAYRNDTILAMTDLLRVVHRDRPGELTHLAPNVLQMKLWKTIQAALTLKAREGIGGPLKFIILKQRRGGVSSFILGLAEIAANFSTNFTASVVAHKETTATIMNDFVHGFYDYWPADDARRPFREFAQHSQKRISIPTNASQITFDTAGGLDPRGGKSDFVLFTEYAHYEKYDAAMAMIDQATPHAWIFKESTANGPKGAFYNEWNKAMTVEEVEEAYAEAKATGDWSALRSWGGTFRFFFSWHEDPGYRLEIKHQGEREDIFASLDEYERALVERFPAISAEQIKWRRWKISDMGEHSSLTAEAYFAQEYPAYAEEAFQGSGSSVFDQTRLRAQEVRAEKRHPIISLRVTDQDLPRRASLLGANLRIWQGPRRGHDYVIGGDVGHGVENGDYSVAPVYDRCDGTVMVQVAEWRGIIDPRPFGNLMCILGELYNGAFLIPEVRGPGLSTCEQIIENRYSRIYHRKAWARVSDNQDDHGFSYGFLTGERGSQGKQVLVDELKSAIKNGLILIRSLRAIHEMRVFECIEGVYGAPDGDFDDEVIGHALAWRGQKEAGRLRTDFHAENSAPLVDASIHAAVRRKISKSDMANKKLLGGDWKPRGWQSNGGPFISRMRR